MTQSDVNRPALQLAGFFDYFDSNRIQIIGQVEYTYMEQKGVEYSVQMLEEILCGNEKSPKPPCIVFCRNLPVDDRLIELATKYQVPILRTKRATNEFMADLIQCLNYNMAPRCTVHGVLVDIYGEGILIMGESGIGKSEVALELIHRGHRLLIEQAKKENKPIVMISFSVDEAKVLYTPYEKEKLAEYLGIDCLLEIPLTKEFCSQTPEEFAKKLLCDTCDAASVIVGSDFRFGAGRSGDTNTLQQLGEKLGFSVTVLSKLELGGEVVSSTRIRSLIGTGKMELANELLGTPYFPVSYTHLTLPTIA